MSEKEKKKQVIKISVFITSIFVMLLSVTYAFINVRLVGEKKQVITAGELSLELEEDENNLTITNALPMYDEVGMLQDPFTFRLVNNGSEGVQYVLKLVKIKQENELDENLVRFHLVKHHDISREVVDSLSSLTGAGYSFETVQEALQICQDIFSDRNITTEDDCVKVLKEDGAFLNDFNDVIVELESEGMIQAKKNKLILDTGYIKGQHTIGYEYRMWLDADIEDKKLISDKSLSYRLEIEIIQTNSEYANANMIKERVAWDNLDFYENHITSIAFEKNIDIPRNISSNMIWDIGVNGDETVMAYLEVLDSTEDMKERYKLHIQGNGKIYGNFDSSRLFAGFYNLESITGLEYFDTINVTDMSYMFDNCSSLISLDLSNFDTTNVTDISSMFDNCSSLTSLDLSNFDTTNVTDISSMFDNCSSLISLDVSHFDTSKVTSMWKMFYNCSSLTSLDLSNFDTSRITSMWKMFYNCSSLTNLNLSNFDTSNVTNMMEMFYNCSSLTNLNLSNFDTSNVTNMMDMFYNCSSLASLDLTSFNTSNVTNMIGMFYDCSSLASLDLTSFNTSNVTNMSRMFYDCSSLISLDVSNFDTSKVISMYEMFFRCSGLTTLDLSNFDTSKVTDMGRMFDNCSSLIDLDVSNFNTSNVENMSEMFEDCSSLTTLDLSNFNTLNLTNMGEMFYNCNSLATLDLSNFNISNLRYTNNHAFDLIPTNTYILVKDEVTKNWVLSTRGDLTNVVVKS